MTDYYLWLDTETTGLNPDDLTVLEFGWTVTDASFRQLTPLRSRISALHTSALPVVPEQIVSGNFGWSDPIKVDQVVRDMHNHSGLRAQWLSTPSFRLVKEISDFDRLLLDDLWSAGWQGKDPVYLAGAGISHFDRPVIDSLEALTIEGRDVLHYRAADVSSAIQILGVSAPKDEEALAELVSRTVALTGADELDLLVLKVDPSTDSLAQYRGDDVYAVNTNNLINHRAASDVAYALVVARCLRALIQPS